MRKINNSINDKGNILLMVIIAIVVVAAVSTAGFLVYSRHHKSTQVVGTSSTSTDNATKTPVGQSQQKPSTQQPVNVYAGWETHCDSVYNYCFKYPATWTITSHTATGVGATAQTTLQSPDKAVEIYYVNADSQDRAPFSFSPTSITPLSSANQNVTLVGGYFTDPVLPSYNVVDTSLLTTYPLTIGQTSTYPNDPYFTEQGLNISRIGSFRLMPSGAAISNAGDAQSWLQSAYVQTGVLVLKSFYYNH